VFISKASELKWQSTHAASCGNERTRLFWNQRSTQPRLLSPGSYLDGLKTCLGLSERMSKMRAMIGALAVSVSVGGAPHEGTRQIKRTGFRKL
jgi:hypothetical protein